MTKTQRIRGNRKLLKIAKTIGIGGSKEERTAKLVALAPAELKELAKEFYLA